MKEVMLTLNEVAELEEVSHETVRKRVKENKLEVIKIDTKGEKKGLGYEYRVPFEALTEKAKKKYYANLKAKSEIKINGSHLEKNKNAKYESVTILDLTAEQRKEIAFWENIICEYNIYISEYWKNTTVKTKEFVAIVKKKYPDKKISERTLRRKLEAYKSVGQVGLADLRGQSERNRATRIDDIVQNIFLQYWLDEARPCVSSVYKLVHSYLELDLPELLPIPNVMSFHRLTKNIPTPVIKYFRYGNKAYEDECLPYLEREYENIESNEIWSADYHTLDFFVRDDVTGQVYRPHLIAWIDIRSRKILSITLTNSSSSNGTIVAFRKAVMKYGIPKSVYLDNGREFLVSDFGGRSKRKTDINADYGQTILQRLGVVMHNAIVGNAKAKIIERVFRNVTFDFSKFIKTYVGGKPEQRPERLKNLLKDESNIPLASEVSEWIDSYIEGWYNEQKSNAKGLKGQNPNECYIANLFKKRTATKEQLNLMLLRSSRLQEVKRNGVYLKISSEEIYYYNEELVSSYLKEKVYVRYDPENLKTVHIYDSQERYLCTANIVVKGNYEFGELSEQGVEAIKTLNTRRKNHKKQVLGYMEQIKSVHTAPNPMDIIVRKSNENMKNTYEKENIIIEPMEFAKKAVGNEMLNNEVTMDIARMVENAMKNKS